MQPQDCQPRQDPGGHGAFDERDRSEESADLLADQLQVQEGRPTSPSFSDTPTVGPASSQKAVQSP